MRWLRAAHLEDWPADRSAVYDAGYAAWGAAGEEHEAEIAASKWATFADQLRRLLGRHWFQFKWEHVIYWDRRSLPAFLDRHGLETLAVRHNRKTFRLSYYEYYFRRYALLGPVGVLIGRFLARLPASFKRLSFANPVTGEMLVIARKPTGAAKD